jgi:hypothetical protein
MSVENVGEVLESFQCVSWMLCDDQVYLDPNSGFHKVQKLNFGESRVCEQRDAYSQGILGRATG